MSRMHPNRSGKLPKFRTFVLLALLMLLIAGVASAYELTIDTPLQLQRGMPIIVNGTSNLPAGISVDVVLSRSEYSTEEIARETVTLQGNKNFTVIFDTMDLTKGQYKVEVPGIPRYSFLGSSVTLRVVTLIDRTDEITITSQRTQQMDGFLRLNGAIKDLKNSGVQIEVVGPGDKVVFGPAFVATNVEGSFSKTIPITEVGQYEASFTDGNGYIGTIVFTVKEVPVFTVMPTDLPSARPVNSAVGTASKDHPAYFLVSGAGPIVISTSAGMDWVLEYTDADGIIRKVNNKGKIDPEQVNVEGNEGIITVKVYPYLLSEEGEVTLTAEGAESIQLATGVPEAFASTATPTTKSPVPAALVIMALLALGMKKAYR